MTSAGNDKGELETLRVRVESVRIYFLSILTPPPCDNMTKCQTISSSLFFFLSTCAFFFLPHYLVTYYNCNVLKNLVVIIIG